MFAPESQSGSVESEPTLITTCDGLEKLILVDKDVGGLSCFNELLFAGKNNADFQIWPCLRPLCSFTFGKAHQRRYFLTR